MARPYAVNSDLQVFIAGILGYESATSDFGTFLDMASADVLNLIKADWWTSAVTQHFNNESIDVGGMIPNLDEANINDAALVNLTCYRAFSQYIMPYLTKDEDQDGDQFSRKGERYAELFAEEWALVKQLPLYDFNGDAQFTDIERRASRPRRVKRA